MEPTDEAFRDRLLEVLGRSRLSRRGLSSALGRDPGYVAALLDPTRPSRTRPTPADLVRASDATGIAFVELLELLWAIPRDRLVEELGPVRPAGRALQRLTDDDLVLLAEFAAFLRRSRRRNAKRARDSHDPDVPSGPPDDALEASTRPSPEPGSA